MSAARPLVQVGAIAVAERRANVVGTIRLNCEHDGLRIDLLQVGRFGAGFALAQLARAQSFRVPYAAIRALVRDGPYLLLSLDPRAAPVHSRFALAHFSLEPQRTLLRVLRRHARAQLASAVVPLALGAALLAWLLPRELAGGRIGVAAAAALVAGASWRALAALVRWLAWGGPDSDELRRSFEDAVSERLGLSPAAVAPLPEEGGQPSASALAALGQIVRPRAFVLVGAALGALLVAALAVDRYGVAPFVELPVVSARGGIAQRARPTVRAAVAAGTPHAPPCRCQHTDSPLWRDGLPQLSILLSPRGRRLDRIWVRAREDVPVLPPGTRPEEIAFDLAIVNNSSAELLTVDLVVTFASRGADGRRHVIGERGLHWPGRLGAGGAVKWSVVGDGTELRVETQVSQPLGAPGIAAAPPEAFRRTLAAKLSAVRLHGAMMLAYLGQAQAGEAARALGPLAGAEQAARAEILRSLEPLRSCDRRREGETLSLCVHNGMGAPVRELVLAEVESPGALGRRWRIEDLFAAGHALRVTLPLAGAAPPAALALSAPR
ncbi:MAG: hypothetical protein HY744_10455 [Deltaproteobacteria bacterium]|nr:hypothetical protein [Deltaproteobacteria bacterium]